MGFWYLEPLSSLDFVHWSPFKNMKNYKRNILETQVKKGGETPTELGPIGKTILNIWAAYVASTSTMHMPQIVWMLIGDKRNTCHKNCA